MSVLQVIQQGELRGAEVFALDLVRALRRQGRLGVGLVSLFGIEETYRQAVREAGLDVAALRPDGRARGFDLRLVRAVREVIDEGGYQIVQANGAATLKYLAAARRLSRRPWRLVYRAIGMGSYWRRDPGRRWLYRWLFAQPDRVVAVSQAVADDLQRAAGVDPRKVTVIPNGVDGTRVYGGPTERTRVREALRIAPHECVALYAGNLAPEKNLHALLWIVRECRRQGAAVRALVVGDGPCRDALAADVEGLGLRDAVFLLPSQARIGPYLAAADLCVLPSLSEGMPALLIEAGLAGLPAVAYAVGGVPEVVEDGVTGLLAPPEDQEGLCRAVAGLVTDPARRTAMGEAARARCGRFEIGGISDAYSRFYAAVLDGRAS
ncbi:MAG: glycosyltransferase family 4 protein [Armatimonadota bacterium]|nr:glycosyltransferase family 4 protein [Armatimonadota bacterium]